LKQREKQTTEQFSASTTVSIYGTMEFKLPGGSFCEDFLKYEQSLPTPAKYGGQRTSKTAQGVMALNEWMLPPLSGKRTVV
jgi:hypothetical protein